MSRMSALMHGRGLSMSIEHCPFGFRNLASHHRRVKVAACHLSTSPNDAILPRLPVPPLDVTLKKFMKTVRPHLDAQELRITSTIVNEFGAPNGVGSKLQSLLEKKASTENNWLADWWLQSSYLDYRSPVVVFSNPGHVWPFRVFKTKDDQLRHAARVILGALDYKRLVDEKKIPQDKAGKDLLDMSQYNKVLGTCRIPGLKSDTLSYNNVDTISVFHNNHIFVLSVKGSDGIILNEEQFLDQLRVIASESQQRSEKPIGILTTEHRDNWGKSYNILLKDDTNKANLKAIEETIFSVCLDAGCKSDTLSRPERQTVAAAQTIHGGGSEKNSGNRWFDKTVQFIINEDGINGLTYEHSPAEGQPVAVLVDHVIDYVNKGNYLGKSPSKSPGTVKRIDFKISPEIEDAIRIAKVNVDKLVADLDLNCFTFEMFGKEFIKSHKLSPDSFIQMAIQFAFYRIHRIPGAHYETASTRKYTQGRTETIRSCSEESIAFAETMLNDKASIQDKVKALQLAIKAHKDYTVEASNGFGVDRHLLGLKLIALENNIPLPKLYKDAGFVKSSHMRISTSQVASLCDGFMCFAPLVVDGYATCYNPRPNDINFATSAFNADKSTSAKKYKKALEDSLIDMHNILMKSTKSKL